MIPRLASVERDRRWFRWALLLVLALAFAARLRPWTNVFTPDGVALWCVDTHYYIRFARLQLAAFPRFVTFDPFINFPDGASIYWPPLHTWLLALAIAIVGGQRAEIAAAWLGPVLTLLDLLVVGLLARRWFGRRIALGVLVPLAFLPVAIERAALGTADHHVHEGAWTALSLLALAHALGSGRRRDAVVAGLILGAGRFFTPSAFGLFPLAGLVIAAWALRAPAQAAGSASVGATAGGVSAALLLAGSVA
ncbi:MAG: glycosyltransferase family 39 protein, partial [candidate division NC10 bacterium]|nr:glycosyltransferase family 39 protein [candidate division NC10 bacterium]